MSDWIEKDGKKYFEESYLLLANSNTKREADRVQLLEEAITEISLRICKSEHPESRQTMNTFEKVMDAEARKRMGI